MMSQEWAALLNRYGQAVTLHTGEEAISVRAFLQPIREKGQDQRVPGPLGFRRADRFLYLGSPDQPLTPECRVEWNGTEYEVQTAHPVQAGTENFHIWAVLRPRDEEAET